MKHLSYLSIIFALLVVAPLKAESPEVNALRQEIEQATADTSKVILIDQLFVQLFREQQTDLLYETAQEGLQLAKAVGVPFWQATMQSRWALALRYEGRTVDAINAYQEALSILEGHETAELEAYENAELKAKIHINLGGTYQFKGDYELALRSYLQAITFYEKAGQKADHAKLLNNIAVIYKIQKKYERAQEIYQQSLDLKTELNDSIGMAVTIMNMGLLFLNIEGQMEEGIAQLKRSLALFEALQRPSDIAGCQASLGNALMRVEEWDEAETALQEAWAYYEHNVSHEYTIPTLVGLGELAEHNGNLSLAEHYYEQGKEYASAMEQETQLLYILMNLVPLKGRLGKHKEGLDIAQEALELQQKLHTVTKLEALEELQVRFDVEQKETQFTISQLELAKRTQERNLLWGGLAAMLILGALVIWNLTTRSRIKQQLAQQEILLQQQRIQQLEQEKKVSGLQAMIQGQEKERKRIARDLHDGLGGLLAATSSYFHTLAEEVEQTPNYHKTGKMLEQACVEVRRISHNLMPQALDLAGLSAVLEDFAQSIRHKGMRCELELIGLDQAHYPDLIATNIYRIIQELSNNVLKHAQADSLLIQVLFKDNKTYILVEDNGVGFEVEKALQQDGLGLSSVHARVQFLQGEIQWDAVPGEGTTVSITV